jgi:hypothetical protein
MARGKPNLAFLEALNKDRRRRGDQAPGGVFKTPEWFGKPAASPQASLAAASAPGHGLIALTKRKSFMFTPPGIAAGVAAMLIIATVGYVGLRKPEPPQLSASIEAIRETAPQGNVMDLSSGRAALTPPAATPVPVAVAAPTAVAPQASPAGVVAAGPRTVGMNYVVFQSYKDEKTATEARDALVAGGIGATVEKGHPYAPTWFVVIGTHGFARTNAADYLQYINKGKAISEKFAGKNKWKQFEPNAYKWR